NAFLHHMVRNIAGVLMQIGCGERPVEWAAEILAARNRHTGGLTAPAYGLYLVDVTYPEQLQVPSRDVGPHWLPALNELDGRDAVAPRWRPAASRCGAGAPSCAAAAPVRDAGRSVRLCRGGAHPRRARAGRAAHAAVPA